MTKQQAQKFFGRTITDSEWQVIKLELAKSNEIVNKLFNKENK